MKNYSLRSSIEKILDYFFKLHKDTENISDLYDVFMIEVEKILIEKTLIISDYNKRKASEILGISRNTLNSKIARHKIILRE